MKTEVFRWRVASDRLAELKAEARRRRVSVSALLDRITSDWLAQRRLPHYSEAEQAAIRKRAMAAIGPVSGNNPARSGRRTRK